MTKRLRVTTMRRQIAVYERRAEEATRMLRMVRQEHEAAQQGILSALRLDRVHPYEEGFDPFDILDQIRVEGEHWIWCGQTNHLHGSPVVYPYREGRVNKRTLRGAPKVIDQIVRGCQHQKAYQPQCDAGQACVRPSHRCGTCHTELHAR